MDKPTTQILDQYKDNLVFPSYQDYQLKRLLPTIKIIMLTGVFFFILFSYYDFRDYPKYFNQILMVRISASIPLILIIFIIKLDKLKQHIPVLILVLGLISLSSYVYLHTFLNEKIYLISLAYIYFFLVIVTLAPLYSNKQIIISFIIGTLLNNLILFYFAPQYHNYLSTLFIKSIGTHVFTIIVAIKVSETHIESYKFALLIHKRSMLDSLTQVYNRHGFDVWSKENLGSQEKPKPNQAIIMLDIDDFKSINDVHGHQIGDWVIKNTAQILKSIITSSSSTCIVRFGGEEFIIFIQNNTRKQCISIAEEIRKTIEEYNYKGSENQTFNVTVSIGISFEGNSHSTLYELIGSADKMLYHAKINGKNKIAAT
ncbi:MAG: GGDEF domain-containing protein [Alcanivoracaceae bacterium]|nr:GGDEF domain-containing protein [Alcanivoracaceae bacterium]